MGDVLSIKKAMNQYFSLREEIAQAGWDFLFKTSFDRDANSLIYVGEVYEDEYISWQPVERETLL
ncbi:hypothetical protein [Paenibacillus sp. RC67]|uniref:hypothetical protein n=1 Tax=Paenibacillus sp. RC67 TaxID=3039392 RepID=UPI0024AE7CA4|nr:hypothetical protein [Paenibacillus sp. RC67]